MGARVTWEGVKYRISDLIHRDPIDYLTKNVMTPRP